MRRAVLRKRGAEQRKLGVANMMVTVGYGTYNQCKNILVIVARLCSFSALSSSSSSSSPFSPPRGAIGRYRGRYLRVQSHLDKVPREPRCEGTWKQRNMVRINICRYQNAVC